MWLHKCTPNLDRPRLFQAWKIVSVRFKIDLICSLVWDCESKMNWSKASTDFYWNYWKAFESQTSQWIYLYNFLPLTNINEWMHKSHFPICEQDAQDTQMTLSDIAIKKFHWVDAQESFSYMWARCSRHTSDSIWHCSQKNITKWMHKSHFPICEQDAQDT
jgi:hypothetical protein